VTTIRVVFKKRRSIRPFALNRSLQIESRRCRWVYTNILQFLVRPCQGGRVKCHEASLLESKRHDCDSFRIMTCDFIKAANGKHTSQSIHSNVRHSEAQHVRERISIALRTTPVCDDGHSQIFKAICRKFLCHSPCSHCSSHWPQIHGIRHLKVARTFC
jgi:hypothetical protein